MYVKIGHSNDWRSVTSMCFPFSASSEGRIRNLGLESKIGTFLGPFWHFGPIWDKVPNLGPFWSAWLFIAPKCAKGQNQLPFHTMKTIPIIQLGPASRRPAWAKFISKLHTNQNFKIHSKQLKLNFDSKNMVLMLMLSLRDYRMEQIR